MALPAYPPSTGAPPPGPAAAQRDGPGQAEPLLGDGQGRLGQPRPAALRLAHPAPGRVRRLRPGHHRPAATSPWTGVHLCTVRLKLLRLNTMPALDSTQLRDVAALAERSGDRAARPRPPALPAAAPRAGEPGFSRITWDEALDLVGGRLRATDPRRVSLLPHLARHHQRDLLRGAEGGPLPRHEQRRQLRPALPRAQHGGAQADPGGRRVDLLLQGLVRHRPARLLRQRRPQQPAGDDQVPLLREAARARRCWWSTRTASPGSSATGCPRRWRAPSSAPA